MLARIETHEVAVHTDAELRATSGIVVAFTERTGGASAVPYATLNLAAHVGDDPSAVDDNRRRILTALDADAFAARLTTAEQVHGTTITRVTSANAGCGARAFDGTGPLSETDALWTTEPGVPLMLFFADCVPVILVSESPRAVAVVHAGWRGAHAGIVGDAVRLLDSALDGARITAYIGPHIGECCYEVDPLLVSQFANMFVTIPRASDRLDLAAAVAEDLDRAGVSRERQWHLGICTAHNTDRFYSYRAEGRTGRHCAFALLEPLS